MYSLLFKSPQQTNCTSYLAIVLCKLVGKGFNRAKHDYGKSLCNTKFRFSVGKFTNRFEQFWPNQNQIASIGAYTSLANGINIIGGNRPSNYLRQTYSILQEQRFYQYGQA